MKFQYCDGGRKDTGRKGVAGDCVVRSIVIASGRSYDEVYKALADGSATECLWRRGPEGARVKVSNKRSARNGINTRSRWFKELMKSWGFVWTACMGIGTGCRTHLADGELPSGRLVVAVSKHYTAVIENVIYDTYDPQRNTMITENGVTRFAGRCVYGFWKLANA